MNDKKNGDEGQQETRNAETEGTVEAQTEQKKQSAQAAKTSRQTKTKTSQKETWTKEQMVSNQESEEAVECFGRLKVRVFVRDCADGYSEKNGLWDAERSQPLRDVEVALTGRKKLLICQATDEDGWAVFPDIPIDEYEANLPERYGYEAIKPQSIKIDDGTVATLEIGYIPKAARVEVYSYYFDEDGEECGLPAIIDVGEGDSRFCIKTSPRGRSEETLINCPGLTTFIARSVEQGGCTWQPRSSRVSAFLAPGRNKVLRIPYERQPGQIQVAAILKYEAEDRSEPIPANFYLYVGDSTLANPIQTLKTEGLLQPKVFRGLTENRYTITAQAPKQFRGMAIESADLFEGKQTIDLSCGDQNVMVKFLFQPCLGNVAGLVIDGTCGKGLAGVPVYADDGLSIRQIKTTDANGVYIFPNLSSKEITVGLVDTKVDLDDKSWEAEGQTAYRVSITPATMTQIPLLRLVPEETGIYGTAISSQGKPRAFVKLDIIFEDGELYLTVTTDEHGYYDVPVPHSGNYFVGVRVDPNVLAPRENWYPVMVNSKAECNLTNDDSVSLNSDGKEKRR
ncbi:MAG: hypothetical protein KDJ52_04625 [Anaerolineae bacterium]|nr:hypothetical protein [Anaerolineae bacterium]